MAQLACFKNLALLFGSLFLLSSCKQEAVNETPSRSDKEAVEESAPKKTAGGSSGLPLPRYVSLKAGKARLHVGPGDSYPVDWVYVRRDLPVQITAEFDTWRQIKDHEGNQGWVHKTLLSSKRTVLISTKVRNLRAEPDKKSKIVAKVEPQVIAKLLKCQTGWCQIQVSNTKGWINKKYIWGVEPFEEKIK